jgi:hypothetical protein|tara:strand:+ start:183 stop:350 length:168 start_codon:yes stop_codon:yes gene_type:complete
MTKIYDFKQNALRIDEHRRKAYGYSKEIWDMMKENGYNVNDPLDIDQFFEDLGEG